MADEMPLGPERPGPDDAPADTPLRPTARKWHVASRAGLLIVMTVMTVTTGGVMWYVLTDLGSTTAESINFVEPAPGNAGGGYRNAGLQGMNVEDLRLTIVTEAGRQVVPLEVLIGQIGPTFDPREIICVVGDGCIVPAVGTVRAELQVRGQAEPILLELVFADPVPGVVEGVAGSGAPALPGLPELQ